MTDTAPDQPPESVAGRRQAYDEYVAREIPLHATMDHDFEIDPFDEDDVEGHMPACKKC